MSFYESFFDALAFKISASIVENLTGALFFNLKDDEESGCCATTLANPMKLLKVQEDGSYIVTIKNPLRFQLFIDHTSSGLFFR